MRSPLVTTATMFERSGVATRRRICLWNGRVRNALAAGSRHPSSRKIFATTSACQIDCASPEREDQSQACAPKIIDKQSSENDIDVQSDLMIVLTIDTSNLKCTGMRPM